MPRSRYGSAAKQVDQQLFLQLTDTLSTNYYFTSTIQSSGYQQSQYLSDIITTYAVAVGFTSLSSNTIPLQYVVSRLGSLDSTALSEASQNLLAIFQATTAHGDAEHRRQTHIADRIGLLSSVDLPIIFLRRLQTEYPPRDYFILENPTEPIPPPLPLRDPSCRYRTEFHILDESQLSALFVDIDNGERIAVVIRNFARSYFPAIQQWAVLLLHDSISRRTLSLRNNPGQLARVGVSEGPRNARLFSWVRNLKSAFRAANDRESHDQNISSLFGLFYALLRSQIPWLAAEYEAVMSPAHLPRLDTNQFQEYTIPIPNTPITFFGYPLSPPEGYIAVNFAREIHWDRHWNTCP